MELRELWKVARRRWWLILLPVLAAAALTLPGMLRAPAAGGYATSIRFTAATPPEPDATNGYEDREYYPWLTSEYVVNALTDWVRTSSFAAEISAALAEQGLEVPAGAIQAGIAADNERSVMVLHLSGADADVLAQTAEVAADVLETQSVEYFPQFGASGVEVVALDVPAVAPVPASLSARLEPLVRIALGLAAGVALAFLVEYLDPTVRERRHLERLGMPVLAEVPDTKG